MASSYKMLDGKKIIAYSIPALLHHLVSTPW